MDRNIKLLTQVETGTKVKIRSLNGGRGLHARLAGMGLIPGLIVEVISQGITGPSVIVHNGCRLAIGRGMAQKIIVSDQ